MAGVTALLLAGRRPGTDPLASARGVRLKVLIPVAGRTMIARVAETLAACPAIGAIRVLTQDVEEIRAALPDGAWIDRSGDGIARSIAAVAREGGYWPLVVTTADHPLLTPATIAAFLRDAEGADVAVGVVERRVVRRRFSRNRRTWLRFRDGAWTGANLFWFAGPAALPVIEAWASVERDRKKGWRLVARFGPVLLLRALTRTIGLEAAVRAAGRRLDADVRVVALDDPLAAVDVDKMEDLAIAESVLEGRP